MKITSIKVTSIEGNPEFVNVAFIRRFNFHQYKVKRGTERLKRIGKTLSNLKERNLIDYNIDGDMRSDGIKFTIKDLTYA